MLSPRWKKLMRDMRFAGGRLGMMLAALTTANIVVAAIFSAYAVLEREVPRNYAATRPASAQLVVDGIDDALLRQVRRRPDIAFAEAGATVRVRMQVAADRWLPVLFFVVPDFSSWQVSHARFESGVWPSAPGSMLVERTALPLTRSSVGETVLVRSANGHEATLSIVGVVLDAGVAPAWQEQTIYGYISPETLQRIDGAATLTILKIVVAQDADDAAKIDAVAGRLADWLDANGHAVREIRLPPPNRHPHQGPMDAVLALLLSFSVLSLLMAAILAATTMGGLLAQQTRQVAIMKVVGASTGQVAALYLVLVGAIAAAALAMGLPLGSWLGHGFVAVVAQLLNLDIASYAVPGSLLALIVSLGVVVPVAAALLPIAGAATRSLRESMDDSGLPKNRRGWAPMRGAASLLQLAGAFPSLIVRNTFRRRLRLGLTLTLLATAGALFIACINLKTAWNDVLLQAKADQLYDLGIRLQQPQSDARVASLIGGLPGVSRVESWPSFPATAASPSQRDISHAYPDGGHGALTLRVVPMDTQMMAPRLSEGRWLAAGDSNAVVINAMAKAALFADAKIGDDISLQVGRHPMRLKLAGIVSEILTGASVYVLPSAIAGEISTPGSTNGVRIALTDPAAAKAMEKIIVQALVAAHMDVDGVVGKELMQAVQGGHLAVFLAVLMLIAVMMAVVGTLGLASTLSTAVIERTREFGVLRVIGARPRDVLWMVGGEALLTGVLSGVLALIVAIPITLAITRVLESIMHLPLALILSTQAVTLWFAIVCVASLTASVVPAVSASRLTVREAFGHI